MAMSIHIAWLYHDILNIYGDRGNLLAFQYRCQQRNIATHIDYISVGTKLKTNYYDFIFGGGGQDKQQLVAGQDLQLKKKVLTEYAATGTPMLLICGSYQLFGHYFLTNEQKKIPGISILNCYTVASKIRKIGNVVAKINPQFKLANHSFSDYLVGFENHSGNTFIGKQQTAKEKTYSLAKVIQGAGNNGSDQSEGAVYKNVVGTYLHGSLLPKNPHWCDWLIKTALKNRYKKTVKLKQLNDKEELLAHKYCQKLKY